MRKMWLTLAALMVLAALLETWAQAPLLSPEEVTFYQDVAWSPNSQEIATSAMRISRALWEKEQFGAFGKSQFDIYILPTDGAKPTRVTDSPKNDLWAAWWPTGRCLLYSSAREGSPGLYFTKTDGSDIQKLYQGSGLASEPAVSPDGKKVAFMYREGPESHIYVLRSDGPEPVKLTTAGPNNWGPMWSPDGTQILFYSNRKGKGRDQIFLINADGSGERQLTHDPFNNIFPSWSADGRRILFLSNREGQGKEGVFVMDADGSNPRRLDVGMRVSFARWSPDGKHLAFIAGEMPDTKIYVAAADGSNPRLLTR